MRTGLGLVVGAAVYYFHPLWGVLIVVSVIVSHAWRRYGPLVSYSFSRWVRDTEEQMNAEKAAQRGVPRREDAKMRTPRAAGSS